MQSQSRRYIILGGAALVVLLFLFFMLSGSKKGNAESVCNQFIDYVIAQDAEKTYDMFSEAPQRQLTRDKWKETMVGMQPAHYKATYELSSTNDLTPEKSAEVKDPAQRLQLNYIVSSPPISVDVSCSVLDTDEGLKVDAYTMSPRLEQETGKQ
jgi:hypothetical protein